MVAGIIKTKGTIMESLETKIQMVIGQETLIVEEVLDKEEVDFLKLVILMDRNSGKRLEC